MDAIEAIGEPYHSERKAVVLVGSCWVSNYPLPEEERRWFSVFDPDGRWVTDVDVPEGLSVLEIGPDYVLALVTDELDLEHVRLYPLHRN